MKKNKRSDFVSLLNRIAVVFLVITALAVVLNTVFRIRLDRTETRRNELTYYANSFAAASAYLTTEVRAYAATGIEAHHDNYWEEVNDKKNREASVAKLKDLGITPEEEAMIERMSQLSNDLVPREREAMDLAAKGDIDGALDIVYGAAYNESVRQIMGERDAFLEAINTRTANNVERMTLFYNIINALTWAMVAITAILQIIQKRELHRLAYVDELTGGDNYAAFREKIGALKGATAKGYIVSADIKSFSIINDTCGIGKGDEVIREMGKIFQDAVKHGELAAHVSGDRFILFLHSENREALLKRLAMLRVRITTLAATLDTPHLVPLFGVRETRPSEHPENSYGYANLAKQQLVGKAGSFCAFFDEKMQDKIFSDKQLENRFEQAIAEHQFEMWYQPKYLPEEGKVVAAEALVRWRNPDGTLIPPSAFIPLFEKNGMITQLDEYTFETVCAQQRMWIDAGYDPFPISVNISRASLFYPDIADRYIDIANRYRIPTDYVELEITESAVAGNDRVEALIRQFRFYGFRIEADDFGSGYSSLSILTKNYFDNIKIDKSLVDCIGTEEGKALLESIIVLAHKFNMTVTAEGVEYAAQSKTLIDLHVDYVQGYHYSLPLPAGQFRALLKRPAGKTR